MKYSKLLLTAAIAMSAVASQAGNLIKNGDFETYAPSFTGYIKIASGSPLLSDWTVGGTSVDIINGGFGAITGNSIDMLGTPGPGSLSQSFATVIGQTYVLNFDLSRNSNENPYINVVFGGLPQTQFTGGTGAAPTKGLLSYTALSTLTTLSFYSVGGAASSGAVLDNVSVTAVPEPETYAMLLVGLGLMGAVARRRNKTKAS